VSRAIPSGNLQECGVTGSPIDNSETKRALAQDMNSDRYVVKSCGFSSMCNGVWECQLWRTDERIKFSCSFYVRYPTFILQIHWSF